MYNIKAASGLCFAMVITLGACAQQAEPVRIQAEPVYNKFGEVSGCSDGSTPQHSGNTGPAQGYDGGQYNPCYIPPEEECEYHSGSDVLCEQWRADDEPYDSGNDNVPTTGPTD